MDPTTFYIDLKSIAGIVALTIVIVQGLKTWFSSVPFLQRAPVALYVVLVSMGLTLFSHDILHWIAGDRWELALQAVVQALVASGVVEWWRAGAKPLEDSNKAREAQDAAFTRKL